MGMSYGGLIAQHLAADHPELIHRLILAMSVYRFSEEGNKLDMRFAELLSEGKRSAASRSLSPIVKGGRTKKRLSPPITSVETLISASRFLELWFISVLPSTNKSM